MPHLAAQDMLERVLPWVCSMTDGVQYPALTLEKIENSCGFPPGFLTVFGRIKEPVVSQGFWSALKSRVANML